MASESSADLFGRARSMVFTILLYSIFTGLSALSVGFWDFALYRFLTGLGVGGQFAVGVSLVAEEIPDRARPFALGWLQALSAFGNVTAALVQVGLAFLVYSGTVEASWRLMFVVGTAPAVLVVFIMHPPAASPSSGGSWPPRKPSASAWEPTAASCSATRAGRATPSSACVLASSGIIGLWAIGFFSFDLTRSIFRERLKGLAAKDENFWNDILRRPDLA